MDEKVKDMEHTISYRFEKGPTPAAPFDDTAPKLYPLF